MSTVMNDIEQEGCESSPVLEFSLFDKIDTIAQDHFMHRMDVERVNFRKLFRDIKLHVNVGLRLFQSKRNDSDTKFYELFDSFQFLLESAREHQETLLKGCSKYDFVNPDGSLVKANGFRSVLFLLSSCLQPLLDGLQRAAKERGNVFYSPVDHLNALCVYCRALQACEIILRYAVKLMEVQPAPQLFSDGELSQMLVKVTCSEYLCADVFYGKCLGIQYAPTLKPVLRLIGVGMASYEEWYLADKDEPVKGVLQSLWKGKGYLQSPTRMGLKLHFLTTDCSVHFVKAFWSLMEQDAVKGAMKIVAQSVEIRHWLEVPAKPLKMEGILGEVEVKPPYSDIGYKPVRLLLISHRWRDGQLRTGRSARKNPSPPCAGLVVHVHGGGYVAQSPQAHEFYLRQWSRELDVPVVSVDYSLAPECTYPRPLEECLLAYTWILQNLDKLGTTGENIVFVGDSAGGNFAISVAMKLKQLGLRLPSAILSVYPSLNCKSSGSPSRLTGIVDPILPLGVMLACKQAYSGSLPSPEVLAMRKQNRKKILRAKGYYLPDPDVHASPSLVKRWKNRKSRHSGSDKDTSSKAKSSSSVSNPPPRPPLPGSSSLLQSQSVPLTTPSEDGASGGKATCVSVSEDKLSDVDLEIYPIDTSSKDQEPEDKIEQTKALSSLHAVLPITTRQQQEPDENDKLSPAELESLIDELVKSYDDPEIVNDPFMSPLLAPAELLKGLPPIHLIGAALDPILDDVVAMAHKLKSVGQPVTLNVLDNLPHGFLCMVSAGNNADLTSAQKLCVKYIKNELQIPSPTPQKK